MQKWTKLKKITYILLIPVARNRGDMKDGEEDKLYAMDFI